VSLEKLEYPSSGTVTDSWLPAAAPVFSDFINAKRRGVITRVSAGGQQYSYGTALFSFLFRRAFENIPEADRAGYENFRDVVGGDFLKFTDDRGVPHKVKFDQDEDAFRDAFNDNWDLAFALGEQVKPHPSLKKIPPAYHRDLLFYAPLAANLSTFSRWDGLATTTGTVTFESHGILLDSGKTLKFLELGHILPPAGTLIFTADVTTVDSGADIYQFFDAADTGGASGLEIVCDGNAVRARVFSGSATVANLTGGGAFSVNVAKKIGLAWQANDFRLVVDGAEVAADASGAAPTALQGTSIFAGQRSNATRKLLGHIKDLAVIVRALSSAEIITIQGGL